MSLIWERTGEIGNDEVLNSTLLFYSLHAGAFIDAQITETLTETQIVAYD